MSASTREGLRGLLSRLGLLILGGALLLFGLVLFADATLDAASVGLGVAGVMLLYALSRLYAVVAALAGPALPEQARSLGRTKAELRDEKKRLLRAIKELEFDYGMGKLSKADFESVSATYKARAIEVMRALDGASDLHPELAALLREREATRAGEGGENAHTPEGAAPASSGASSEAAGLASSAADGDASSESPATSTRTCAACSAANDDDARFCKRCGKELAA
ncbi:MAG: zinc ribbon domain-containing protein [Nannocystaceae bacterium]